MDFLSAVRALTAWGAGDGQPAELTDRLTYHVTPVILLVLVAVLSVKQYIMQPIQCVFADSAESKPLGYEQYAETMCWIENLFTLTSKGGSRREGSTVYQNDRPSTVNLELNFHERIRMHYAQCTLQNLLLSCRIERSVR